jgi:hypothetical protein
VFSVLRYKIEKNAFAFQVQVKIPCFSWLTAKLPSLSKTVGLAKEKSL